MSDTKIEWADKVWNPVTGCQKVSEGCRNCYAKRIHDMRHQAYLAGKKVPEQYSAQFEAVMIHRDRLKIPLHWKKPARIFVNSMSDLFHPDVPDEFIQDVFRAMYHSRYNGHVFMILTKRPERMQWFLSNLWREDGQLLFFRGPMGTTYSLPNVWLGVSVEDQKAADKRIPYLLQTPAAVRFLSCEPMLGPLDISYYLNGCPVQTNSRFTVSHEMALDAGIPELEGAPWASDEWQQTTPPLNWVICGGESGPKARPMHPDWARSLRDQCQAASVPFFFKRMGAGDNSRELDGQTWTQFPK